MVIFLSQYLLPSCSAIDYHRVFRNILAARKLKLFSVIFLQCCKCTLYLFQFDFNHFIVPLKTLDFLIWGTARNDLITASCSLTTSHSSGILPRASPEFVYLHFLFVPFRLCLVSKSCIRLCCIACIFQ